MGDVGGKQELFLQQQNPQDPKGNSKLEVGTQVQVYWDKDRFRKVWSAIIAEPKEPKMPRNRNRDVETTDGKLTFMYIHVLITIYVGHNSSKKKKPAAKKRDVETTDGKLTFMYIHVLITIYVGHNSSKKKKPAAKKTAACKFIDDGKLH